MNENTRIKECSNYKILHTFRVLAIIVICDTYFDCGFSNDSGENQGICPLGSIKPDSKLSASCHRVLWIGDAVQGSSCWAALLSNGVWPQSSCFSSLFLQTSVFSPCKKSGYSYIVDMLISTSALKDAELLPFSLHWCFLVSLFWWQSVVCFLETCCISI